MPKWRPITPPVLGNQLAQTLNRIEQLERARTRGGAGGGGGVGGIGGPTGSQIQGGAAGPTNVNGEATITFNPAFSALPTILATAGGDGTDMLLCQVKTLSATQAVIVVTGIPVAVAPVKTGVQDAIHTHNVPGQNTQSSGGHDHTIGTGATETHPGVTGSSGVHLHGISTIATDGQSADHRHEITQVPKPTARQGVTVYWIATPRS
jgi:hypothetical protein